MKPDILTQGSHTVFRKNPSTGRVMHYETFIQQTNPKNPSKGLNFLSYDSRELDGRHYNKVLKKYIDTPHVHDPTCPGGSRIPYDWEIPL